MPPEQNTPTPEAAETPNGQTPETPKAADGTGAASTPPATSPDGDAPKDKGQAPEPKPDDKTGDQGGEPKPEDPRAKVPTKAEDYAVNLSDEAKTGLGLTDDDPMVKTLQDHALKNGKPQGWLDDVMEAAGVLNAAGLLDGAFDPAAELAKMGENGAALRTEAETYAGALKERGEISDDAYGELMSLTPTAAGVELIRYFRKAANHEAGFDAPQGDAVTGKEALQAKAQEMARDPRYETDRAFRKEADALYMKAFSKD